MNNQALKSRKSFALKTLLALLALSVMSNSYAAKTIVLASAKASVAGEVTVADAETTTTTETEASIPDEPPKVDEKDSLEGFNRAMFTFNDKIDIYFLKPIATLYNKIMPVPLNKGIHNVYENINTIPTIANDILQANFYQASNDMWRLGINSTVGIGGLFDIAERMNLEPYTNDFGLTLARWGYKNSTYLVLPFFGPNTIRDGIIGLPVDYFAFSLYPYMQPPSFRYQVYALGVVDKRAQLLKFQDVMDEVTYDKYVFVRNAYLQRRAYLIDENDHRSCCDRWVSKKEAATMDKQTKQEEVIDNESSVIADLNSDG